MKIQPEALEMIRNAPITGERLASLFEKMAAEHTEMGGASGVKTIDYQQPGGTVDEQTVIPQLVLILRPVE